MKAKYYSTSEFAKKIGISRQVVSAVINETWKQKRISEATYKRIKDAMEEHGFVPDKTAVSLKKSDRNITGVIYHGPLHSHILVAVQKLNNFFHENDISVAIVLSRESELEDAVRELMGDRVEKIVILLSSMVKDFSSVDLKQDSIQKLLKTIPNIIYNFPFDIHDKSLEENLIAGGSQLIGFSRREIYNELLKELLTLGKKKILIDDKLHSILTEDSDLEETISEFEAVETFPNPKFRGMDQNRYKLGEKLAEKVLSSIKEKNFDTIITDSDMVAQGAATNLHANGINIPEDVNIIGFDKIEAHPYFKFHLPTIQVPVEQMVSNTLISIQSKQDEGKIYKSKAKLLL